MKKIEHNSIVVSSSTAVFQPAFSGYCKSFKKPYKCQGRGSMPHYTYSFSKAKYKDIVDL